MRRLIGVGVLLAILAAWITLYVVPKQRVTREAAACMRQQGLEMKDPHSVEWGSCLDAAEQRHGTALLSWVGY